MKAKLVKEFLNEGKQRYVYDKDLGVPFVLKGQIGFTSQWKVVHPEGTEVVIDKSRPYFKNIREEEYHKLLKDYWEHEKFMKKAYKDAQDIEKEEN